MGWRAARWRAVGALLCLAAATALVTATAADTAEASLQSNANSDALLGDALSNAVESAAARHAAAMLNGADRPSPQQQQLQQQQQPSNTVVMYGEPKTGVQRGARMLVLSAGTLAYDGNHPGNASIATPEACRAACAALPGCGGWNFCNNGVHGCGTGCKDYSRDHPRLTVNGPYDVTAELPITAFGPWTYPHTSVDGCHPVGYDGGTSDAWPFGLCTLLDSGGGASASVAASDEPPYAAEAEAAEAAATAKAAAGQPAAKPTGWVSAKIVLPTATCDGLSPEACTACLGTANPEACIKCARDRRASMASAATYVTKRAIGNDATRGCTVCANVTSQEHRSTCFDCVLSSKPCATCALGSSMYGTGTPDVTACLSCVSRRGQAFAQECNECAQTRSPSSCFSCLDDFDLKICPTGPALAAVPLGSCRTKGSPTPCARCANSAKSVAVFEQCLKCHADPNRDQECGSCGTAPEDAVAQARCFSCVTKAGFKSYKEYGCAQCYGQWISAEHREECLNCVESTATPSAAKRFCSLCSDGGDGRDTPVLQRACYACLQAGGKRDYSAQCVAGDGARRRSLRRRLIWA